MDILGLVLPVVVDIGYHHRGEDGDEDVVDQLQVGRVVGLGLIGSF